MEQQKPPLYTTLVTHLYEESSKILCGILYCFPVTNTSYLSSVLVQQCATWNKNKFFFLAVHCVTNLLHIIQNKNLIKLVQKNVRHIHNPAEHRLSVCLKQLKND
jgi:hypothetical protein